MFDPSQADVRQFFCRTWQKHRDKQLLTPLEAIALDIIIGHPEYQEDLADEQAALNASYPVEQGRTNPFLHLSMHLAIAEQKKLEYSPCSATNPNACILIISVWMSIYRIGLATKKSKHRKK